MSRLNESLSLRGKDEVTATIHFASTFVSWPHVNVFIKRQD